MVDEKKKVSDVALTDDVKDVIWNTLLSVLDTLLVKLIQNIDKIPLGSFDKYKPVIILLAEFLRKTLLGGIVAQGDDGVSKEDLREQIIAILDSEFGTKEAKPAVA